MIVDYMAAQQHLSRLIVMFERIMKWMLLMLAYASLKDGFLAHLTICLYLTMTYMRSPKGTHDFLILRAGLGRARALISYLLQHEYSENTVRDGAAV